MSLASFKQYHQQRTVRVLQQREQLRTAWLHRAQEVIGLLAPQFPAIQQVALFGSIAKPGRFHHQSDIDVAVICLDAEQESRFWRALEEALQWDVDLRPLSGPISQAVQQYGAVVYG